MRDLILREIKRLAEAAEGQPPGVAAFTNATGITEAKWRGVWWARWGDALAEAGYQPNALQRALPDDAVLLPVATLTRRLGRLPTRAEIKLHRRNDPSAPSAGAVARRYVTNSDLIRALLTLSTREEWADIASLLPIADEELPMPVNGRADGQVYLIRSGAHYKIGRSDQLERRVKEIRVALPDAVTLVHAIRTDDPSGIEAYWHRRFADRRANGEWFLLSAADVKVFCRRTFQ